MVNTEMLKTTEYLASLLLAIQRGESAPPLPDGITHAHVYKMSKEHSLAAASYVALSDTITAATVPDEYRKRWSREAELATVQHLRQSAAFSDITRAFTEAKVRFLPLKGFLFKALWTRPELRTMADMDILVSCNEYDLARETLLSLGYCLDHAGDVHDSFTKGFINVELHKMLYDGATDSFDSWMPREDNPYWYQMPYDKFLEFNLRHAYKHYEHGGCGLRAMFDFYLVFEKYGRIDDPAFIDRLKSEGLYDFYTLVLRLVDLWFYGISDDGVLETAEYIASGGVYGTLDNGVRYSVSKKGSKAKHVLSRIFPPYKDVAGRYKWVKKCPILLPVAYVVRIFTAIFDGKAALEMKSVGKIDKNK